MKNTSEYYAVQAFYGDRTAKRSGVRLMDHIDQGLIVLQAMNSSHQAQAAFCLHPLFQADQELKSVGYQYLRICEEVDPIVIMLVMEYRQ